MKLTNSLIASIYISHAFVRRKYSNHTVNTYSFAWYANAHIKHILDVTRTVVIIHRNFSRLSGHYYAHNLFMKVPAAGEWKVKNDYS